MTCKGFWFDRKRPTCKQCDKCIKQSVIFINKLKKLPVNKWTKIDKEDLEVAQAILMDDLGYNSYVDFIRVNVGGLVK